MAAATHRVAIRSGVEAREAGVEYPTRRSRPDGAARGTMQPASPKIPHRRRWTLALVTAALGGITAAGWQYFRTSPEDARLAAIQSTVAWAARGDSNALEQLHRMTSADIPGLCQLIVPTDPTPFERRISQWRGLVPAALRRILPDPATKERESALARRAVVSIREWGSHLATAVRAECAGSSSGNLSDSYGILGSAAYRIAQTPAQYSDPDTIAALVVGVTNSSPWIRLYSVQALGSIGPLASNALPVLRRRRKDSGRTVSQHVAHAIFRISGHRREALDILFSSLGATDIEVLKAAVANLARICPGVAEKLPSTMDLLANNADHGQPVRGLPGGGEPGGPMARSYLESLASDADPEIATAAEQAVRRLLGVDNPDNRAGSR